jgi:hypothetical protein
MPAYLVRDVSPDDFKSRPQDRLTALKLLKEFPNVPWSHLKLAEFAERYIAMFGKGQVIYADHGYMTIRGRPSWFHLSPSTTLPGTLVEGILGMSDYRVFISKDPNHPFLFY